MKSANTAAFSFTVAAIFGDHMVLQRDKPVRVWGESQIPQTIRVSIDGSQVASTQAGAGPWQITLPPMQARRGLVLQIAGQDQAECRTFQDVAIGEVWIAGGQSNMEFALEFDAEAKKVIPGAANPDIRFYDCPKIKFEGQEREDDLSRYGFWRPLNPANAPFYSAVGYYFASRLHERLQVPIGMVGCNWGGTTAATWLDESYLKEDETLRTCWQEYEDGLRNLDLAAYTAAEKKGRAWSQNPLRRAVSRHIAKHTPRPLFYPLFTAIIQYSPSKPFPLGPRDQNRPGGLYHTMVQKIAGYAARGVIWYQGETDDARAELYARLFSAVIRCWRNTWEDDLPFLFVQLAPYGYWLGFTAVNFHILREQQDQVSKSVPGAHMASIMDAGLERDVHPKHKRPVGERLALLARGKVYGEAILCEPPEPDSLKVENGRLVIAFRHAGDGLRVEGSRLKSLELLVDGQPVNDLEISVVDDTVIVRAGGLAAAKELEVRLAYRNYAEVNLYNSASLPAKPFRRKLAAGS